MELHFQPCKDKSCRWGGWRGKKWHCCCDPAQYGMCSSGGDRPKKNAAVAQNTSTNIGYAAALWKELRRRNGGRFPAKQDWVAVTKERLNAALKAAQHCA